MTSRERIGLAAVSIVAASRSLRQARWRLRGDRSDRPPRRFPGGIRQIVGLREFLGPADLFSRLDADGNGLIDRREAEAAEPSAAAG